MLSRAVEALVEPGRHCFVLVYSTRYLSSSIGWSSEDFMERQRWISRSIGAARRSFLLILVENVMDGVGSPDGSMEIEKATWCLVE